MMERQIEATMGFDASDRDPRPAIKIAAERMEKAQALAGKITLKAEDALSRLNLEMNLMKWPAEFRAIMWGAVAEIASRRAFECEQSVKKVSAAP